MIYEKVPAESPIQQGDIFRCIPRIELSLEELAVIGADEMPRKTTWKESLQVPGGSTPITAILPVKPVTAITITQNCDAARAQDICLCQVDVFLSAVNKDAPKDANKWQSLIREVARNNPKLFYLPTAQEFGLEQPMAADLRIIIRVPRSDLEAMRADYRIARLNSVATEHFRETLAHFFRRYAYNEWYPLTGDEFKAYQAKCDEPVEPYPWQGTSEPPSQP